MAATPNTIAVSDIHKAFPTVMEKLEDSPLLMLKGTTPAAWLISTEEWDRREEVQQHVQDLEEIIELLKLEIDRLEKGLPESVPADIAKLEQLAQRVSA